MGNNLKTYVSVTGEVKQTLYYKRSHSERNKRVGCPLKGCDNKLVNLYAHRRGVINHYGLYCDCCNTIFVFDCYKVFKMGLE